MKEVRLRGFSTRQPIDVGITRRDFLALSGGSAALAIMAIWGGSNVISAVANGKRLETCTGVAFNPKIYQDGLTQRNATEQRVVTGVLKDGQITKAEGETVAAAYRSTIDYEQAYEKCWSDIRGVLNKTILPAGLALLTGLLAMTKYEDL